MRKINYLSILFIGVFLTFTGLLSGQVERINIPDDLCFASQPTSQKSIAYDVTALRSECLMIYGSNPNKDARKFQRGKSKMDKGKKSSLVGIVKLFSVTSEDDVKSFNFGPECGEAGVDDANVMIGYNDEEASNGMSGGGNTPFKINISRGEVLTVIDNDTPDGNFNEINFVKVLASRNNTATISITRNVNQGQVIIAVFRAKGNPNPIALLDPKGENVESFTTDSDVYVIPIIRPKMRRENDKNTIFFEVGDPEENGKVEVEEEG